MNYFQHYLNLLTMKVALIHLTVSINLQLVLLLQKLKILYVKIFQNLCVHFRKFLKARKSDIQILWMFVFLKIFLNILLDLWETSSKMLHRCFRVIKSELLKQYLLIINKLLMIPLIWLKQLIFSMLHKSKKR